MATAFPSSIRVDHATRLPPAVPDVPIYRLSADQYHAFFDAGILFENSGVEFIDGWVLMKGVESVFADAAVPDSSIPSRPVFRFSVDDYHLMPEIGILQWGDPIELIEGWLVPKMTKKPPHEFASMTLWHFFNQLLPETHTARNQSPVTCGTSEPEPDLSMVRGSPRDFVDCHPAPEDVALVVEVAAASLKTDRGAKRRVYAEAGIAEYWIVNLIERRIEVYTQPSGPANHPSYACRLDYVAAQTVPLIIDGKTIGQIAVSDVLP